MSIKRSSPSCVNFKRKKVIKQIAKVVSFLSKHEKALKDHRIPAIKSSTTQTNAISLSQPVVMKLSLFLLLGSVAATYSQGLSFPRELQDVRYEYLNQKGYHLKLVDRSFFDVYNHLKANLDTVTRYYVRYNASFAAAFENIDTSSLKTSTSTRLRNIYTDVDYVLSYAANNVNALMNNFYVGMLGFYSDPQDVAGVLYDIVEESLNTISKLWARNKACLKEPLKKYHAIYVKGFGMIVATADVTKANISALYRDVLASADKTSIVLKTMTDDLNKCKKEKNMTDCLKTFVSFVFLVFI
jgi:hypothetical protein